MLARKEMKVQRLRKEMDLAARQRDPEAYNPKLKPTINNTATSRQYVEKTQKSLGEIS